MPALGGGISLLIIIVPVVPVAAVSVAIIGVDVGCDGAIDGRSEERRVGKGTRYWRDWSSDVCSSDLSSHIRALWPVRDAPISFCSAPLDSRAQSCRRWEAESPCSSSSCPSFRLPPYPSPSSASTSAATAPSTEDRKSVV